MRLSFKLSVHIPLVGFHYAKDPEPPPFVVFNVKVIPRSMMALPPLPGDPLGTNSVGQPVDLTPPGEPNRSAVAVFRGRDDGADLFWVIEQMQRADAPRVAGELARRSLFRGDTASKLAGYTRSITRVSLLR